MSIEIDFKKSKVNANYKTIYMIEYCLKEGLTS